MITAGAAVELPKEHHSAAPVAPPAKEAPHIVAAAAPAPVASGGVEAALSPQRAIESKEPAISSNAVAVAPATTEEVQTSVAPTEEVTPPEEIAPPDEGVAVEEPAASGSEVESTSVTGGIEVDGATAASPTTVPGAHGGKGTVTVTVAPEAPATTPPPRAAPAPAPVVTPAPVETAPPAEEAPGRRTGSRSPAGRIALFTLMGRISARSQRLSAMNDVDSGGGGVGAGDETDEVRASAAGDGRGSWMPVR